MLENNRSKLKQTVAQTPVQVPSYRTMMQEPDIRFLYRFVQRYDIREKALEVLSTKLRQKNAH
jgi:hypothetical protein